MAYDTAKLSIVISLFDGSYNEWIYRSADTFTTVKAANYITDAKAKGMKVRDKITVVDTASPATTLANILTVAAAGATMSQTGVVIAE